MPVLELSPLTNEMLSAALELDQQALGGIWTRDGYLREIESPNSDLWVFRRADSALSSRHPELRTQNPELRTQNSELRTQNSAVDPSPPLPLPPSPPLLLSLGCLWAIAEEAHITLLAVAPDYQQQGLGQAMLYILLKSAHNRGLERATLEVRVSNSAAIALYEKFGFREAGRRKRYYQDTGEDGLILWLGGFHRPDFPEILAQWEQVVGDRLARSGWQLQIKN